MTKQEAFNAHDMLTGCINRMFVTDSIEEIIRMKKAADKYLQAIYAHNRVRLAKEGSIEWPRE